MPTIGKNNALRLEFESGSIVQANLSAGKTCWLTFHLTHGADSQDGNHVVFSDLLRHD